jgi:formamidopyrimidine-DNA glycosylase
MPELPEVTTTVNGLNKVLPNLEITAVWSDYFLRTASKRADNIKNKKYFEKFKKEIIGQKIKNCERRGKNVLINLTGNKTVLVHMKMTGHFLYDRRDKFIHLDFSLSNGKHLTFSDMRKFAKIFLFETDKKNELADLKTLGPEPLDNLSFQTFQSRILKKTKSKIKTVLMDQSVVAGIGNIYSDEILWQAGVRPERAVGKISVAEMKKIWSAMKKILRQSISLGGDSMSDYRNIHDEKGKFQNMHKAYRRAGKKCSKNGCGGIIKRMIIGGRSAHFCPVHQK